MFRNYYGAKVGNKILARELSEPPIEHVLWFVGYSWGRLHAYTHALTGIICTESSKKLRSIIRCSNVEYSEK